uniref:NELF-A N-terminal domain-containing protein n=1 Tax=Sciurus vulgaris TaxID=55149 RepID=A0A8D2B9U7_SCIVU
MPAGARGSPQDGVHAGERQGLWLHNKLGASTSCGRHPASRPCSRRAAVIDNIRLCFHRLSLAVNLKLLLRMLHLLRRTVDEMKDALMEIIHMIGKDFLPLCRLFLPIADSFLC